MKRDIFFPDWGMPETGHLVHFDLKAVLCFIFIAFFNTSGYSQIYPDHRVDSTLRYGISRIILQNYTEAEKTFKDLEADYPWLPLGNIYLAAVKIARSYDYGTEYDEPKIDSLLSISKEKSQELIDENDNIWNRYFLSLAEGYLAYFKGLKGDWLNSLSEGVNALGDFEDLLAADSSFYEAYIAIGTFKYWKSRKTEFLNWLPGYTDESAEGISLLKAAVQHSTYNTYLAINSLIWIYIDRKEFTKAADLAEDALKKYPGSRFFEWGLARACEDINKRKAIRIYRKILDSLPSGSNHYNEIILKHLIAQQYAEIGETGNAIKMCDEILSIRNLDERTYSRLENRLKRVAELKRELSR
jgi:predicted Zn-dependent protease